MDATNKNPRPYFAKDAGPFLEARGFTNVSTNYDVKNPRKGDISIIPAYVGDTRNDGKGAGHISFYNGEQWISDVSQGDIINVYRNRGVIDSQVQFYRLRPAD